MNPLTSSPLAVVLAHGLGDDALPMGRAFVAYLVAAAVLLAVVALRTRPAADPLPPDGPGVLDAASGRLRVGSVAGAGLLVATVVGSAAGGDRSFLPALLVGTVWWCGGLAVALLVDWYRPTSPWPVLGRLASRGRGAPTPPPGPSSTPWWIAAAMVGSFFWFWLVWSRRNPSGTEVAAFLVAYGLAVLLGARRWGPGWTTTGEGFAVLFAAVASLRSPRQLVASPSAPAAGAIAVVLAGATSFDRLDQAGWWRDLHADGGALVDLVLGTGGLVACGAAAAIVGWATVTASRLAAGRRATRGGDGDGPGDDGRAAGRADLVQARSAQVEPVVGSMVWLLPLGVLGWLLHNLPVWLIDVQNTWVFLSDPMGRGWDLLGTMDTTVRYEVLSPTTLGGLQIAVVALAGAWAVAVARADALRRWGPVGTARADATIAVGVAAAAVVTAVTLVAT